MKQMSLKRKTNRELAREALSRASREERLDARQTLRARGTSVGEVLARGDD